MIRFAPHGLAALCVLALFGAAGAVHAQAPRTDVEVDKNRVYANRITSDALLLDVYYGRDATDAPVLVSLHGGSGSKDDGAYVELSRRLADEGVVVFNASYRGASPRAYAENDGILLREALESAVCATRHAAAHASEFGGAPDRITLLGHSAGGFFGLLASLLQDEVDSIWGEFASLRGGPGAQVRCTAMSVPISPRGFVGFNGAYFVMRFFGVPESDPELWQLINPGTYAELRPDLRTRFFLGSRDSTQPPAHLDLVREFANRRASLGYESDVVSVDTEHNYTFEGEAWDRTLAAILEVVRGR